MRFVGIDLAWSLRKTHLPETGGVALDDAGRMIAAIFTANLCSLAWRDRAYVEADGTTLAFIMLPDSPLANVSLDYLAKRIFTAPLSKL